MLEDKIKYYKSTKQMLNNTPARYKKNYDFLTKVDSFALVNSQINLQNAYNNFFRNPKIGYPNFKSWKHTRRAYKTNYVNNNIELKAGRIKLPKAGLVKIKQHREIPEGYKLKSVTVSQSKSGKFFASILFEYETEEVKVTPKAYLGLDFSMNKLYVDSNGKSPQDKYLRLYRKSEKKIKREQRKLSLMKEDSKNRAKQRIKLAKIYEKIANSRTDFLHKQSRQIANVYDCVCIEDINMQGISQGLNFGKSVHDDAYGKFTEFLSYKLLSQGKYLVKVGRFYPSTQLCSVCGFKNRETKDLSIREWICPVCGTKHDRDINAAVNIRNEGKRLLLSKIKQEPTDCRG